MNYSRKNMSTVLLLLCFSLLSTLVEFTQECTSGNVRLLEETGDLISGLVQYCYNGGWSYLCTDLDHWGPHEAVVTCRQLGYSSTYSEVNIVCDGNEPRENTSFVRVSECNGVENTLQACHIENETDVGIDFNSCRPCKNDTPVFAFGKLSCHSQHCTNGELRLVGGANNREGRVEVCMDGRWGTVCNSSQNGIAGDVCSELGFPAEGAELTMPVSTNCKKTYNCRWNTSYNHTCGELLCDSAYLNVRCLKYQEANEINCPEYTECTECTQCQCSNIATPLGAVLGVLMAVLVAIAVGWTITFVIQKRGSAQSLSGLSAKNESFSMQQNTSTQQESTGNAAPTDSTYSSLGPNYSVIRANIQDPSAYDDLEGIGRKTAATYQNVTIEDSLKKGEDEYSKLRH